MWGRPPAAPTLPCLRDSELDVLKDSRGLCGTGRPQELGQSQARCPARFVSTRCLLHLPSAQACFDLGAKGSAASQAPMALRQMSPPSARALGLHTGMRRRTPRGAATVAQASPPRGAQHPPNCAGLSLSLAALKLCMRTGFLSSPPQIKSPISLQLSHLQVLLP